MPPSAYGLLPGEEEDLGDMEEDMEGLEIEHLTPPRMLFPPTLDDDDGDDDDDDDTNDVVSAAVEAEVMGSAWSGGAGDAWAAFAEASSASTASSPFGASLRRSKMRSPPSGYPGGQGTSSGATSCGTSGATSCGTSGASGFAGVTGGAGITGGGVPSSPYDQALLKKKRNSPLRKSPGRMPLLESDDDEGGEGGNGEDGDAAGLNVSHHSSLNGDDDEGPLSDPRVASGAMLRRTEWSSPKAEPTSPYGAALRKRKERAPTGVPPPQDNNDDMDMQDHHHFAAEPLDASHPLASPARKANSLSGAYRARPSFEVAGAFGNPARIPSPLRRQRVVHAKHV